MMMTPRFDRHALISGWSQDRLSVATVVIAGVGALGNFVAQSLALAGVGRLILCDPDVVAESNLSRTPLFTVKHLGKPKVHAAGERLGRLSPGIVVDARPDCFEAAVGLGELRADVALVMGCLDSRSARLELAGRCALVRMPSIDAATDPWGGEVRPFFDPDGPCFGCSLSTAQRGVSDTPWSCLDHREEPARAAAAPSSGLVGSWAALLAVRMLSGLPVPPETIVIDGTNGEARRVAIARDPDCLLHRPIGSITPLDVSARITLGKLRAMLPSGAEPLLWRPAERRADCRICGHGEESWRLAQARPCPRCGAALMLDTTLATSAVPDEVTLAALGIPEREILAARVISGFAWFELKSNR